ncbi:MAG: non-homologous end-joining DNA ligase [Candidatus Sericytochromatia bacterium]|nr:non-homologous end-joining DNA ligase [Candidatus Tanganyikabacteria bacterium]
MSLIPPDKDQVVLAFGDRQVTLTNLRKVFWPAALRTKGDLLRYYATLAPVLLPHVRRRAMTMKRYPDGVSGDYFFMKRLPPEAPPWLPRCEVPSDEAEPLVMPIVDDLPGLLWVVNLGCVDLNPSYGRCDGIRLPDYLHFDLDPTEGATFGHIREAALLVREGLAALGLRSFPKTTGSRGIHVYVPIVRRPTQEEVWMFAKAFAHGLVRRNPALLTAEYAVRKRPRSRVHVDYNQNSWGRTLASVYSVRPVASAAVSAPVTWSEVRSGVNPEAFRMETLPGRIRAVGDLWAPVDAPEGRCDLNALLAHVR